MNPSHRRLRTPEERVGQLAIASLPPPRDTAALLESALLDGNEQAFATVIDAMYPAMLRLARSHVRSHAIAEEVVQDTWLAALQGIHRFERRAALGTWLFRILRNIARARGRRDARMQPLSELVAADAESAAGDVAGVVAAHGALWTRSSDPERELLARELGERIEAAIAALPPRQREVLVLRDCEGWDASEVCNILAISETNQRVILHRARERVRHELRPYLDDGEYCADATDHELH